ncbi:MAG: DUF1624 domain-containing protein [Asgard group archaeon]|nr:DUF1624 domain-containing protein [Asgard group archaeon]
MSITENSEVIFNEKTDEDLTSRVLEDEPLHDDSPKIRRIATLDFFRGFAILFMIAFHIFMKLYDYSYLDFTEMPEIPLVALVFMGIAAFFGTWHGFFLFISSIVNTYVTIKKAQKNTNHVKTLLQLLLTGVLLIFIGWLEQAFGYFGYFGGIIQGKFGWTNFSSLYVALFQPEPLQIIGLSLIVNSVILFFLTQNKGHEKYRRNMLIYFVITMIVLIISIILSTFGPDYIPYFTDQPNYPDVQNAVTTFGPFRAWMIAISMGGLQPIFPFMMTPFAGAMIGLTLAKSDVKIRAPLFGILIGFGLFVLGIIYTIINIKLGLRWTTIERNASVSTYLLRLGFQIMVVCACLSLIEFRGRGARFGNRSIVKFVRFWGIISLTMYILQLYEYFPRWLLTIIFKPYTGIDFLNQNFIPKGSELLLLFSALFVILWFYILQWLWSKIHYIGTFEWCILKIQEVIFKTKKSRLNTNIILHQVEWINFGKQN